MPFTPLHLGVGACCKAVGQQRFSFMIFAGTQILMDLEPLFGMIYGWQYLHIITHNLLGASLIGCLAFVIGKPISEWVLRFILKYGDWRISWKTATASALIGSYSHILLDTFMHHDVYFFYPWILKNPLANLIPYSALFYSCIFMAIIGTSICLYQLKFKNKRT